MLDKILKGLKGYKTYAIAAIAVVLNFCVYMKWITVDQLNTINVILAGFGLAALRAGVSNK